MIKIFRIVIKFSVVFLFILLAGDTSFSQNVCEIYTTDFNTEKKNTVGTFVAESEGAEENSTFKVFSFPKTKLFITAGVQYSGSALQNKIHLSLILGKKGFNEGFGDLFGQQSFVLSTASTSMLLERFKDAEISTLYLGTKKPIVVTLKCSVKEETQIEKPK